MNLQTLKKQLVREFRASPAKAIALGVLFVVGLYFWTPIVAARLFKKSSAPPAVETASTSGVSTPVATAVAAPASKAKPEAGLPDWHDVADWIERDARTKAVAWSAEVRNPFAVTKPKPRREAKPLVKAPPPQKPKEIDPDELGLVVTGVALGPGGRTAMINGQPYREGHTIALEDGLEVQLRRVSPKRVQFECQGQSFELAVASSGGASAIVIRKP